MRRGLLVLTTAVLGAARAGAQCRVDSNSNEGKLLAFYTAPIAFSMATAPQVLPPASIRIGGEGEYIPRPDPTIERTGACFTQKSEHTSLSPVFGRPRITIGGPFGFALEAAYLPPVTIARATPNLFSFAVSQSHHFNAGPAMSGTTLSLRFHGTFGNVKGAITCPKSSLQQSDPAAPCYGTSPSKDTFHPDMFGGEAAVGFAPGDGSISWYGGAGANRIDPHFQVGFTSLDGNVDRTEVVLRDPVVRATVFGGVTAVLRNIFDVGAQVYSVPSDATLFRLMGGLRIR
ncbi:MAG TPA: hypothetical protein VFP26_03320 [Gemmatimonadaceae bacterium]|jgi:hypothetical protein|nr:hypothetical protein [Gemmatimonadaceae bacterium]